MMRKRDNKREAWQDFPSDESGAIRTRDLLLRRETLYPSELRARKTVLSYVFGAEDVK